MLAWGCQTAAKFAETTVASLGPTERLPVAQRDVLGVGVALVLVVPALGVLQPLLGQALEERVDELVVLTDAGRREPAGQEQRVGPVDLLGVEQVLHQGPYSEVPAAYRAAEAWLVDNGWEAAGPPWESYLDGPEAAEPRTLVHLPCRPR